MTKQKSTHHGDCIFSSNETDIIDCQYCGFAHVQPLPSDDDLTHFYQESFYDSEKPDYLRHAQEDLEWIKLNASDRYEVLEVELGVDRRSLLDVGCGPGFFLDVGQDRGWNVMGIEPSKYACDFVRTRGLDVKNTMFNINFASNHKDLFDAVHLCNVLEHVPHPAELIQNIKTVLAPGGLVCITVPNDFNLLQKNLVEQLNYPPYWISPKHHLNYFSYDTIESLLGRHGFECFGREASFPLEMFLLMGDDYVEDQALGRAIHKKRIAFDESLARAPETNLLRRDLYTSLAALNLGRLATVYGRLPT